ncbi:signal peptidase II [Clostridium sp. DSM 8431]|uniref:signal peptidase II n=1 Tax=Clostridium sp. DSM 8431 TaxID=1761781 RepID=UPI0008E8EDCB|nr:signal peptidase II [Clostridium sp. DSM 8431]SFU89668.1 signal peptidase II [Clostridium sp. DSM 8431]
MKNTKLITIGALPLMWIIYFLFELITGRITTISFFIFNCALILLFSLIGYFIYLLSKKYINGFSKKATFLIFIFAMFIDQGIKLIIKAFFFNHNINIIPELLSFNPIINTQGSWLNARFNTSLSFSFLITINFLALILLIELYRYLLFKGYKTFWGDMAFIFLLSGALCSLIDKCFYGGSLDFIGISDLFVADIKDIYINFGLYSFILAAYSSGYLTSEDNSTLKDDINSIKLFFNFIKKDILSIIKKH